MRPATSPPLGEGPPLGPPLVLRMTMGTPLRAASSRSSHPACRPSDSAAWVARWTYFRPAMPRVPTAPRPRAAARAPPAHSPTAEPTAPPSWPPTGPPTTLPTTPAARPPTVAPAPRRESAVLPAASGFASAQLRSDPHPAADSAVTIRPRTAPMRKSLFMPRSSISGPQQAKGLHHPEAKLIGKRKNAPRGTAMDRGGRRWTGSYPRSFFVLTWGTLRRYILSAMDRPVNPNTQDIGEQGPASPTNRATKSLREWAILLDARGFRLWAVMSESSDSQGIFSGTTVHLAELLNVRRSTISDILNGTEGGTSLVKSGIVRPIDRARWFVDRFPHPERPENRAHGAPGNLGARGAERPENRALAPGKPGASRALNLENSSTKAEKTKTTTTVHQHPIQPRGVSSASASSSGAVWEGQQNPNTTRTIHGSDARIEGERAIPALPTRDYRRFVERGDFRCFRRKYQHYPRHSRHTRDPPNHRRSTVFSQP